MLNYGEALKYQRELAGLSQLELSKKIGTSHQNVNRWERGEVLPNIEFCVLLADYYCITLDELVGRDFNERIHSSESLTNEDRNYKS
jgi:transcriptional regulator with XRE-family HTH domain